MSSITTFCFITFCVDLSPNLPDEITQTTLELRYLELSIEFINKKLESFEDRLKVTHERDSNDILYSATNNAVFVHVNPALRAVRNAVLAAALEGRNSSHCNTIAARIIKDEAKRSYYFEIIPCLYKFTDAVEEILKKVETLREDITGIQNYFSDTVPSCYISTHRAECLSEALGNIKYQDESLQMFAEPVINEEKDSYPRLKHDFETRISSKLANFENAANLVRAQGILCAETTGTFIHCI